MKELLATKMRALAEQYPAKRLELIQNAEVLEKAVAAAFKDGADKDDMKKMIGAWARARRVYCSVTGESLI